MNIVLTGATGMVGKAVLLECMESDKVTSILAVNRNPIGITHPKLTEVIHKNWADFSELTTQFENKDACFYCMGVSAFRMNESDYTHITLGFTKAFLDIFYKSSPQAVFNYVSGMGTDSSEEGRVMWARVKGKVENLILNMGFKDAYAFRPGGIYPTKGVKSKTPVYNLFYKFFVPIYPLIKNRFPIIESDELGRAMINSVLHPQESKHLEYEQLMELSRFS